MIRIENVRTPADEKISHMVDSSCELTIDARGLLLLPALIDPHVHLRSPGHEHKEDWVTGARAAIAGGITTLCDMPNNEPPCVSHQRLQHKHHLIRSQLEEAQIPLRYGLYLGAAPDHLDEIRAAQGAAALKIFMGSSTGTLLVDKQRHLDRAFRHAAERDLLVAVHAEDEKTLLRAARKGLPRPAKAARIAVKRAIKLAKKYGARLYILHVSCREELDLIRKAKDKGLQVYAEATPHHLFLDTASSDAHMNPPLRSPEDREALWEAIHDATIDTIGTDHAPHLPEEKQGPEPAAGIPGLETLLPLMITACDEGLLTLHQLIDLTRVNPEKIFRLPPNDDITLIDPNPRTLEEAHLQTKCGWSPFAGRTLRGFPRYTIVQGRPFKIENGRVTAL